MIYGKKQYVTAAKQKHQSLRCADYNHLKQICYLKCSLEPSKLILRAYSNESSLNVRMLVFVMKDFVM